MKQFVTFLLFLPLCTATASQDWTNRLDVADRHALASLTCRWSADGLALQLAATNHAVIQFRMTPGRMPDVRLQLARLFDEAFEDAIQTWPVPAPATNLVTVALRRQSHAWMLYVADQPVARFPEPWTGPVSIRHAMNAMPPPAARDQYVQRTAPFKFEDAFMVPATETNQLPSTWERCSGDWHLHSVTGKVSGTVRARALGRQPTPEHSPNFYSLEGSGHHAIVLAGDPFAHGYSFRAAVQHNAGTNGLVFLATDAGACHGFTTRTDPESERLIFELWRGSLATNSQRQVLAAVATELLPGQWTLMEVRVSDDHVVCLVDNIELLSRDLPLPSGGRFGFYADHAEGTRFDDVVVASHEDYRLDSPAALHFHTLSRTGRWRETAGETLAPAGGAPMAVALNVPGDRTARMRIFGATDDGPHKLEICLQPPDHEPFACSLLAGWQGPAGSCYRFTYSQDASSRRRAILACDGGGRSVERDAIDLGPAASGPVRLTLDALRPNELRGLVNGRLTVLDRPAAPLCGAGGIQIEGRGRLLLSRPSYISSAPLYTDRFEKNLAFINDPFMRHWAAPEGQWITLRDGLTWLRGDIMGRVKVRLPLQEPSVVHLAIPEGETNGQCVIRADHGRLAVSVSAAGTNPLFTVAVTNLPQETVEGAGTFRFYTVNLEDDLLWLARDGAILGRAHLPPLAKGRRLRVEGFNVDQLHQTFVRRENVFDTLFNESLQNWTINGGSWEVVNRFQCEPSWSHMNGENGEGFAGLWSNYEMSGDFCVELYAGMRMGWEDRPGDFNLTVLSRRDATCDGYSLTTAGWDPDQSRLYTRLFRNGDPVALSTAYTAPRLREGGAREGYEPLLPGGRPIHGAWYGVRFRRVGDCLSSLYDNEPVISWRDPHPLEAGSLGVWTYRNSIMVARVRIAAESIRPRPFHFAPLPLAAASQPAAAAAAPAPQPSASLRLNGRPAEWLDPAVWRDADPVGQPQLRFRTGADGRPEMRVTALQGAGTFLIAPQVPPAPCARLLGWRFEVARHPEARFNFEFSVGHTSATEGFTPSTRYSYIICGSDEARGERRIAGHLDRPATPSASAADGRAWIWTPVEVWLPSDACHGTHDVAIDGFGNLQPSDVQQGLSGNPPGSWYAVRHFRELYSGLPVLDGPAAARGAIDAWTQAAARLSPGKLQEQRLPATLDAREPIVAWAVRPEAEFGLGVHPDAAIPEALRISSLFPWPSALLPAKAAHLGDDLLPGWPEENDYVVLLPRTPQAGAPTNLPLTLELADGRTFRQFVSLPALAAGQPQPPVLLTCDASAGGALQTFETRSLDPQAYLGQAGFAFAGADAQQGAYVRFQNNADASARLDGRLLAAYDPVLTPLLQFRYKGDPMAHVSLSVSRCNVLFSESAWSAAQPAGATGLLDRAWHSWIGTPLNAAGGGPLRQGFAVSAGELRVGSRANRDQTGRYSSIAFDDIASGPAVGPKQPLTVQPCYHAPAGVAEVVYALAAGPQPWTDRATNDQAALHWLTMTNQQVVTPDLTALPEGAHHFLTKARSAHGAWSAVYDLPFLIDRQSPRVQTAIRDVPDKYNGTCLDIDIQGDYAPPVARNLRLSCNGQALDLNTDNGQFTYGPASLHLEIDWPWLLRKICQRSQDGDTLDVRLEGLTDAAGNEAPPTSIPIKLDFKNDKQPPAVLPLSRPANMLVFAPVLRGLSDFFNTSQEVSVRETQQENGSRFIPIQTSGDDSAYVARQFSERGWDVEAYPWLAVSFRVAGDLPADVAPFTLQFRPTSKMPDHAEPPKNGKFYTWTLPATDGKPFVVGHVDWRRDHWNDLLINARDLLREQTRTPQSCNVRELFFHFPEKAKYTFQVRGAAILAPWGANDVLKIQAYDLSGVAGLVWQNGGKSTQTNLRPARLTLPPDDAQWLKLRVADRHGNLTEAYLVPLPPPAAPIPEALPLEVNEP